MLFINHPCFKQEREMRDTGIIWPKVTEPIQGSIFKSVGGLFLTPDFYT